MPPPAHKRILVTGATGLIGINLVKQLANMGQQIRILARNESPLWPFQDLAIEVMYGDITDLDSLHRAVSGCDSVFHLAGFVVLSPFVRKYAEKINVEGTRNIIQACRQAKVTRLIHTSSIAAIGYGSRENPATEESEWNFREIGNPYSDTKRRGEELVLEAVTAGQLDAVVVNPSYVLGAYDIKPTSGRLIQAIAANRASVYPLGGINVVGVEDVVSGHIAAWQKGHIGERYILGSQNLTYRELMNKIAERLGVAPPRIPLHPVWTTPLGWVGDLFGRFAPKLFTDINSQVFRITRIGHYVSSEKAQRELAYRPHSIDASLDAAIRWLRENNMLPRPISSV